MPGAVNGTGVNRQPNSAVRLQLIRSSASDRTACRESGVWCSMGQYWPTAQTHAWLPPRITGEVLETLKGHTEQVTSLTERREMLVSGSKDKSIRVWNLSTGLCLCA